MSETHEDLGGGMDRETCHAWASLFAADPDELVSGMAARAAALGLEQEADASTLIWRQDGQERCLWTFVADPSDRRGEVIFDIFRPNATSYLWHFYRVYTPRS